jgi:NAD(P)-dependent dehydrogenase (short-subunit alcohol dehydrogenase family)
MNTFIKLVTSAGIAGAATMFLLSRKKKRYGLAGKTVLITGGSRGLGLAMAREFCREGSRVAICARDSAEIERALSVNQLASTGAIGRICDITNRESVREMIQDVCDQLGPIEVLVNNAGVIQVGPSELMELSDYDEAMKAHFWGPVYTTTEILPQMRSRGEGRIINISSIGGKVSIPHLLPYCASKFALVGFSEGLHSEVAKDGIVVTTVCPGLMRTGSPRNALFKGKHRAEYAWFSVMDAIPVFSINATRAARQIVAACKKGRAEVILTLQAKIAARFAGLLPGVTAGVLAALNTVLPTPGGIGTARATGAESQSAWSPSLLTVANEYAARQHNEVG